MITVYGLWHLGCVTAACCSKYIDTIGLDDDDSIINNLKKGHAPIFEPGLDALINENIKSDRLGFTMDKDEALSESELVWVTFDTPIDERDKADVDYVLNKIKGAASHMQDDAILLISSQLPAGTIQLLRDDFHTNKLNLAYSPENLRLGKAIDSFNNPERMIIGIDSIDAKNKLSKILSKLDNDIIWMSIESAEMTKHAINGFLAMSVSYANELSSICEKVGANMQDVSKAMKSEIRIGPSAYVSPGSAYSGGTLARDVEYLKELGENTKDDLKLISSISKSNESHKKWPLRILFDIFGTLESKKITILGLTYKPNTNTLRRSGHLEMAKQLLVMKACVVAYDPMLEKNVVGLPNDISLTKSIESAFQDTSAVIVANSYSNYKDFDWNHLISLMRKEIILDPNRYIYKFLTHPIENLIYKSVGVS
tara:strand:- start:15060 stop:16337 length:1278 start_codon:yes stop_codon:yes gene_type:complete